MLDKLCKFNYLHSISDSSEAWCAYLCNRSRRLGASRKKSVPWAFLESADIGCAFSLIRWLLFAVFAALRAYGFRMKVKLVFVRGSET